MLRPSPSPVITQTVRSREARGCQLSLRVRNGAQKVFTKLAERGVVVDFREPDVIRAAPVPLYNTFEDVWVFVDELKTALIG